GFAGGVHDPAAHLLPRLALRPPVRAGGAAEVEMPVEVDSQHGVEVLVAEVEAHPVAQDAGVVDDDVQASELAHRGLDQPACGRGVRDAAAVGDGGATGGGDLGD